MPGPVEPRSRKKGPPDSNAETAEDAIRAAEEILRSDQKDLRSVPYREVYQETGRFERLLAQIQAGLIQRGYRDIELRRLALSAWSGGYGAVESILENPELILRAAAVFRTEY